ncbi:MAG: DUF4340 domain-containing protein [Prolixibacteraceae bacterium]|nr:DUF4340 domain-containing protein [Prolixibacteraceae bacterium]
MIKKSNLKYLLILFCVLLALLIIVSVIENKKGDRSFEKDLIALNAEDVTSITLFPRSLNGKTINLTRTGDATWEVESNGRTYPAEPSNVQSMLSALETLEATNLVSKSEERWGMYEVTDSLATRVQAFKSGKKVADVYIGKFKFSQPRQMNTYVRLQGEKNVFSVEGFLGMTFNRTLNDFRSKVITNASKDNWTRLDFNYPADSSFTLQKTGDSWTVNGETADSTAVAQYLNGIQNLRSQKLIDSEEKGNNIYSLSIEGNNMTDPITINCYELNGKKVLESSLNKGALFEDSTTTTKLFVPASKF